jgi:protein O-GlcNAc transferase
LILKSNNGFQDPPQRQVASVIEEKLQQAFTLHQRRRLSEAKIICEDILARRPNHFDALHLLGVIAYQTTNLHQAEELIGHAIKINPNNAGAYYNRGNALKDLKRLDEAIASYDKAITLKPDFAEAYNNRGNALKDLKRLDEAIASYDKAITLKPDYAEAYNNRGNALNDLKRLDEAIASYDKAITLKPNFAEAYYNRGNALKDLKRLDGALASYDKAIALKPDYAEAYYNRGNALKDLKRLDEAIASYDKAITLNPDFAEAYSNRGNVLRDLKRLDEASSSYDKALSLEPDLVGTEGARLHAKMHLCDWINFDTECQHLTSSVKHEKANTSPFIFLGISSSPDDQLQCAKLWVAEKCPPSQNAIWQGEQYRHDRIHIAYVSADFREHPVSFLIAGMLECHDKSRFDITAISLGPEYNSEMRQRLKASFDHFIDAKTFNDEQIANLVRSSEVDILVDLMGFTADSRAGSFARRPAPIQVNYLGYPATMGASYISYIIADQTLIPAEDRKFYSEKIAILPNSYQVNDRNRVISDKAFSRSEFGLPSQGFVFCCFNNNYKITPLIFSCWMRILNQVDGSVLWLLEDNAFAASNLKKEAEGRGVSSERLVFAKRMLLPEHLARHKLADLFLDTLPYNAHTTASDALWVGLPVLTCLGETFAGRVAASLLNAIGLPELITTTPEAYEHMAIDLATHPEQLAVIKHKLAENRLTTPLFDTTLFTKHIEAAYTAMHERHQAGLEPDHIVVPS